MKTSKKTIFLLLFFFCSLHFGTNAKNIRVLFLGNSYTSYNNLPELVKQLALTSGDTLEYRSNTPGGCTFYQHSYDAQSIALIKQGDWDFVVLQEQSQYPAFPDGQVASQVYPYAARLDSIIKANNSCATTLFYMTWGRKNGDKDNCPYFPSLCTYEGMDSLLQLRYSIMAEDNHAAIAPVAKVWRQLRTNHSNIELYTSDESHPSNNGSFAAACTFYAVLFGKNPELTTYNFSVNATNAAIIKSVAKQIVFDSLDYWYRFKEKLKADFSFSINDNTVTFNNISQNANSYSWILGDGNKSSFKSLSHTYLSSGTYEVSLIAKDSLCGKEDSITKTITLEFTSIQEFENQNITIYPNPTNGILYLETKIPMESYIISDMLGKQIHRSNFSTTSLHSSIDLSDFASGIYSITLYDMSLRKHTVKIIKK